MKREQAGSDLDFSTLRSTFPHPLGSRAKVLLTSVFGPYAQDDKYGSRIINPMELYHNQVTRVEGLFSLRMFHRSWGLMLIQTNISAPCTLLDFPTLDRFVEEIRGRRYDVVGISSITTNVLKVQRMCELVRQHQPTAVVVVGGHVANIPDLERRVDADWIVQGEGVRWFRRFLGENPDQPIQHPVIPTRIGTRNMGISVKEKPTSVAATLIPSVGCPMGCNFCATSAMFGGKGKRVDFYRSGDELFDIMCQIEGVLANRSFFVMDENFLFHRWRALRLLELMEQHDKSWMLYIFSRDFAVNGPSMLRVLRTTLAGWQRYKTHADPRILRRFAWEVEGMATTYSAVVGAAKRYFRGNPALSANMSRLLKAMNREFGWKSRFFAVIGGPYVLWKIRQEERRLARGWTYEPPTFYDVNDAVQQGESPSAARCRSATPRVVSPRQTGDGLDEIQEPAPGRMAGSRAVQKVP